MNSISDFFLWLRYTIGAVAFFSASLLVGILLIGASPTTIYGSALFLNALAVPLGSLYYRSVKRLSFRQSGATWAFSVLFSGLLAYASAVLDAAPIHDPWLPTWLFAAIVALGLSPISLFPTWLASGSWHGDAA